MTQSIIGLTQRVEDVMGWGERRDQLDQNWACFVHALGAVALPLPNHRETVRALAPQLDGVILTGGGDLAVLGGSAPERDDVEEELLKFAINERIPLVGVCRGFQALAQASNARLIEVSGHIGKIHRLIGRWGDREVNSFHRYGLMREPDGWTVEACADDGTVEAMRHPTLPIAAVMWHPERIIPFDPRDIALFRNLLALP